MNFLRSIPLLLLVLALPAGCKPSATIKQSATPDKAAALKKLTPEQYNVTQEEGTEPPFKNAYWNNHQEGIYVDIVSGEPLFSSIEKFDSGTGWPSFWQPLVKENIVEKTDRSLFLSPRTEVRSKNGDSHLGHVFNDGPPPTGLRYCINSASLRFIPVNKLEESGYGQFLPLFKKLASSDPQPMALGEQSIVFAGGCFWGVQAVFKHVNGVISATSGYAGGATKDPTYDLVSTGSTGHAESVKVVYDPSKVSLETLLKVFFKVAHDPTELNRQGPDRGTQYRSAIYFTSAGQKSVIDAYIKQLTVSKAFKKPIVTEVKSLEAFYPAEAYHQDYAEQHPMQPYIYINDRPKIEKLRKDFKELWVEKK